MERPESKILEKREMNFVEDNLITKSPSFLYNKSLRLVIFGGKGGTGKTTSSCSTAIYLAHRYPDERFLVVSSDPAHSLADSFNCQVNDSVTPVKGISNLWAIEMDSLAMLDKFKEKHQFALDNLSRMSLSTDQIDIRDFLSFKLPGMEEMMILLELANLLKFGVFREYKYDVVIWDTAPTGHTVRLLAFPAKVLKWVEVFKMSLKRHRSIAGGFAAVGFFSMPGRIAPKGNVNEFMEQLRKNVEKILTVLKNSEECEFIPVTIPTEMSIAETGRLLQALRKEGISVYNIIINRVEGQATCAFCSSRGKGQEEHLDEIRRRFRAYNFISVPVLPNEVRGKEKLVNFAHILAGEKYSHSSTSPIKVSEEKDFFKTGLMYKLLDKNFQFLIFGGKGGVGKTTVSAATALSIARHNPDKKILVFSTDPAHSLSDSYSFVIGDKVTPVQKTDNLYALEINGTKLFEDFREEYRENIRIAFEKWMRSGGSSEMKRWKIEFDQNVITDFFDTYPPGLEEVLALEKIMSFIENKVYDIYIFDTAPTGHLVQLLKFPQLVREWLKVTYKGLLKYQRQYPVENLEIISKRIISSQTTLRIMQELLTDPQRSRFVAVTIAEAMGVLETEDLLDSLNSMGIPCRNMVFNMVLPPTACSFCSAKREEQIGYIQEAFNKIEFAGCEIIKVPLYPHEIRGIDYLTDFARFMYDGNSSYHAPDKWQEQKLTEEKIEGRVESKNRDLSIAER